MFEYFAKMSEVAAGFMPHGHCYLWVPSLVWLNVLSDFLIFFSYTAISASLLYFVFKVRTIPFQMVYILFGTFVYACGITHIMEVINIWNAHFWLSGFIKAITASVSLATAIALPFYFPKVRLLIQHVVESAKMSALGEMAGGIAHEVNNPLTIILGKSEQIKRLIKQENPDLEKITVALSTIENTAEQISKIVLGLKSFSRNGENDPMENVALSKIINDTLVLCIENFKKKSVELRIREIPPVLINCRPIQISQVILNLINNSLDAVESLPEKWIEVSATENNNILYLSIEDSGTGIPSEIVKKMMDPFFTSKGVGKGTGLGLSISKGIIESHGGKLYYELKSNHTCFTIELTALKTMAIAAT